jgi:uncharacterized protein YycO
MVEIGDIVFFRKTDTLLTRLIANVQHSPYTHVGMIVGDGLMVEAQGFMRTRILPLALEPDKYEIYRIPNLTDEQKRRIVEFAESKVYTKYDYWKAVGLFIRFEFMDRFKGFDESNRYICSELVDMALHAGNVPRRNMDHLGDVSPSELFVYYDLQKVA